MSSSDLKYLAGLVVLSIVLALLLKGVQVHREGIYGFQVYVVSMPTKIEVNRRYQLQGLISTPPQRYERRLRICDADQCKTGSWGAIDSVNTSNVYVGAIEVDKPGVYQAYFTLYEPRFLGLHRAVVQLSWQIEAF